MGFINQLITEGAHIVANLKKSPTISRAQRRPAVERTTPAQKKCQPSLLVINFGSLWG